MRKMLLLLPCLLMVNFTACNERVIGGIEHKDYVSKYTEEEHIARISEVTRINAKKKWIALFNALSYYDVESHEVQLKDFTVEIVYSIYDNDPEYFLLQVEGEKTAWAENQEIPTDVWCLGMIRNDDYSFWEDGVGINPYEESGNGGAKKYFGSGHYAVDTGDGVLKELEYNKDTDGWEMVALTEEEKSTYGEFNDPCGGLWDYDAIMKKHVDYVSEREDWQHISLITHRTDYRFQEKKGFEEIRYYKAIALRSCTAEIIYSIYDNDPEYCLVQAQLEETIDLGGKTKISTDKLWYILLIQNDEYYIWDCGYGLNPYAASGFGESVKYHAFGHYAVQTGENELTEVIQNAETGVWEQRVLTDAEKRIYGQYNDATDYDLYYKE